MGYSNLYKMTAGNMALETMGFVLVFAMTVLSICALAGLAGYICKSIGLYTMAKRESMAHPWMAFVPVLQRYVQGELCGDIVFRRKTLRDTGVWLAVLPFLYTFVVQIVVVAAVFAGMGMGFSYMGMSRGGRLAGSLGFSVTALLTLVITFGSILFTAAYRILYILVNQRIFGRYTSETMKTVHAVLSALIPLYESLAFFVMRNRPYYGEDAEPEDEQMMAAESPAEPEEPASGEQPEQIEPEETGDEE